MRLTLQTGRRTSWIEVTRVQRIINLYTENSQTAWNLKRALNTWCSTGEGNPDQRLQSRVSGCGCDRSRVHVFTFPDSLLAEYGPLPFTAKGAEIRWRWWHYFGQGARFDLADEDVPKAPPA